MDEQKDNQTDEPTPDQPADLGTSSQSVGDMILDQATREELPQDFNAPRTDRWGWLSQNYLLVLGGVLVLILATLVALWFLRNQREDVPTDPNVVLNIKGPETLAAGNETEYRIVYVNGENADLSNISLEVFFPGNFRFSSADPDPVSSNGQRYDLPVLRQGQTGEVKVRGKLNGATGESKEIRASLSYTMSNFSSDFSTDASFSTALTAPALEMEIVGPIDVTNGQNATFAVSYKNVSGKEFEGAAVQVDYPEGFSFSSAVPAPSRDNNRWDLGNLPVQGTGRIEITGSFVGDPGSEQEVAADLGVIVAGEVAPQIRSSARFKIQASTLSLTATADPEEVVMLGDRVTYRLKYANYGNVAQSNVVVEARLEGAALDLAKISSGNGIITDNLITWKSATVSSLGLLSPNQSGELDFTVPVKSTLGTNLENQTVKLVTSIYSDQIQNPVRGQEVERKLSSELGMIVSGRYVGGALPMKVGETTEFEISVLLTNLGNDLAGAEWNASMPLPAGTWANAVTPSGETSLTSFDPNASKIRWRVGDLNAFVGKFSPARTMNFRLRVTPSESDRNKEMVLLRDMQAVGMDTFTNKLLESTRLNEIRVGDLGDDRLSGQNSSVQ